MALETIDPSAPLAPNVGSTPTGGLETYAPSVPYKIVPGGKNQLSTITPTSGMLMSPEASGTIKNNMAELLKKYQNPYDEFQSALDDMVARVQYRPTEALRQRAEERQQKEANIYNLKMAMANMDASQAAARNMASALGLGGGVPLAPGVSSNVPAAGGAPAAAPGTMAPTWVDMLKSLPVEQQPIAMAYLQGGDVGNFNKMVQENSLKRPDTQKLVQWAETLPEDKREAVLGQVLEKGTGIKTYVGKDGKTYQYSPTLGLPPEMRSKVAPTTGGGGYSLGAPTVTGTSALSPSASEYVESRGKPGAVSPAGAEGVMQVMPNTQTNPGFGVAPAKDKSPEELKRVGVDYLSALKKHYGDETLGIIAYNMGPGNFDNWFKTTGGDFKRLPAETQSYIGQVHLANSLLNRGGDNVVTRTMGGAPVATTVPTAPVARGPVAKEDVEQTQKNIDTANKAFNEEFYKPLAAKAAIADEQILESNRALEAIKDVEHGPGESIKLAAIKAKMMAGLPVSKDEEARYLSDMTLENVKQSKVARGAKAAMGSQYTGKESDNFAKTLAGINDKNEYIKTIYQIDIAKAKVDKAHEEFLRSRREDMPLAQNEWDRSGIREKIFKDTVDAFNKTSKTSEKKSTEAKPKDDRTAMLEWIAKNPNDPRVETVKKLAGIK